jgi:hypothetical protein
LVAADRHCHKNQLVISRADLSPHEMFATVLQACTVNFPDLVSGSKPVYGRQCPFIIRYLSWQAERGFRHLPEMANLRPCESPTFLENGQKKGGEQGAIQIGANSKESDKLFAAVHLQLSRNDEFVLSGGQKQGG